MNEYRLHIGGEDVAAASGATFDSLDPTTGKAWARHAIRDAAGGLMMRFADLIAGRAEEIAAVEVRDNGNLYKEMVA